MGPSRAGARAAAGAAAFLLPVVYSPSMTASAWTPKAAVVLILAGIGLPRIVPLLNSDARKPAIAGLAFVGVATLATLLSPRPALSLFGLYNVGTGLLFIAALVGAWSLASVLDERGARFVETGLLAGVAVNAAVAIVQGAFSPDVVPFTRYDGRSAGLLANPVYLGALCAAAVPLLLPRLRGRSWAWAGVLVATAAAVELSGSRLALGLAVGFTVVCFVRERRGAALGTALMAGGLVLGVAIGALGGTATGTTRVQDASSGGVSARVHTWASAGHSIVDRPLLGVGPGQFRAATTPHRTRQIAQAEGPDRYFADAHNIVVEYTTTTGLIGVAAFLVFLVLVLKRARGPLLHFALVLLAVHLLEPQFVGTTPLIFLGAGAAGHAVDLPDMRLVSLLSVVSAALAVLAASSVLIGDISLESARLDFDAAAARTAVDRMPPWPEPAGLAGRIALYKAITTHAPVDRTDALDWRRRAAGRDTSDPHVWTTLGETQAYFGDIPGALDSFRRALRLDPWSLIALDDTGKAASTLGHTDEARRALKRSLELQPNQPQARELLAQLGG